MMTKRELEKELGQWSLVKELANQNIKRLIKKLGTKKNI